MKKYIKDTDFYIAFEQASLMFYWDIERYEKHGEAHFVFLCFHFTIWWGSREE